MNIEELNQLSERTQLSVEDLVLYLKERKEEHKKIICPFWINGSCIMGDYCKFAHGFEGLIYEVHPMNLDTRNMKIINI